jgi:hypothetical protein
LTTALNTATATSTPRHPRRIFKKLDGWLSFVGPKGASILGVKLNGERSVLICFSTSGGQPKLAGAAAI